MKLAYGLGIGLLLLCVLSSSLKADEPRASLVGAQPSHYSPDDFFTAKVGYRVMTGQAGFYRTCNDDAMRRYSPYIEWHERPCQPSWPLWSPLATVGQDFRRKAARHAWGQAACGPECTSCKGPSPMSLLRLPPGLVPKVASERVQ